MIGRSWRDESGVALGLAVIVVVLIGVPAAGLLAALRSDLEATTQANRDQRALHLADAGAQAAAAAWARTQTPPTTTPSTRTTRVGPKSRPTAARPGRRWP